MFFVKRLDKVAQCTLFDGTTQTTHDCLVIVQIDGVLSWAPNISHIDPNDVDRTGKNFYKYNSCNFHPTAKLTSYGLNCESSLPRLR